MFEFKPDLGKETALDNDFEKSYLNGKKSDGYIAFIGYFTGEEDELGNKKIQFDYIRKNFSTDNSFKALRAFRDQLHNNVENIND